MIESVSLLSKQKVVKNFRDLGKTARTRHDSTCDDLSNRNSIRKTVCCLY